VSERGLTLLEVVIALLLFSLMAMFLLSGHARASDAILRAEIERDMAQLLRLRIDLIALEYEDYRDRTTEGGFPSNVSNRLVDEEKLFGDLYAGYRWEAKITETVGAGGAGSTEVEGGDTYDLLFPEESESGPGEEGGLDDVEPDLKSAEEVDRMILIEVTIYPPGYDEASESERKEMLRPRSAWTAVHLPKEESGEAPR